jgi:hypothetical protein
MDQMTTVSPDPARRFTPRHERRALWLRWTIGSALGGGVGLALGLTAAIAGVAAASTAGAILALGLGGALIGAILAAAQWVSVGDRVRLDWRWVAVTALGWALGMPVGVAIGLLAPPAPSLALSLVPMGVVSGLLVGTGQWLLLRRHGLSPVQWIGSSVGAYVASHGVGGLALAAGPTIAGAEPVGWLVGSALAGLLSGLVGGALTGFVLARHVGRPDADDER